MEVGTTPTVLAGRYRVLERLGAGGMATVFLAEDQRLGRRVAVKRLHADSPEDGAQRFEREAKVGASLSHPNLVTVFDTVADEEGVLIVMEYVDGQNLSELMARGRIDPGRAGEIIAAVAAALDHAHQAGVVHRDVKPANILVTPDGKVKLVDLGIATATERTQITQAGTVLGTPSYMAPEQLEGGKVTKAVDIYALGAVAFELLAGRKARQGRTPVEIAHQIANGPAPDVREAWEDAPPQAARALQQAMARDPRDRPGSASDLARELRAGLGAGVPFERSERTAATRRLGALAGGAAAGGAAAAADARTGTRARPDGPRRRAAAAAPARRRRLPGWIPLAIVVALLLVAAGAGIALTSGGDNKGVAPVIPAKKKPAKKAAKNERDQGAQPAQEQQASSDGAAASGDPAQMQLEAHNLIAQGRYEEAIALDRQIVDNHTLDDIGLTYAYALYDLGHALRLAGRPEEAIPVLQERLKIDNQRDVVQAELDQAYADAGYTGDGEGKGKAKGKEKHGKDD